MPFESLKDEWEDEMNEIETSTEWQIHVFNETLIFFLRDPMVRSWFNLQFQIAQIYVNYAI